ncbi:MAG TPA: DivIVA domain-containing protein [Candidatus Enterenecus stercoripullorum]|nr:DivIVA domain-containing protein [Candidatus Enterenecus stercoripullorum]
MLTPQEVASHAFAKATLGGYNMAMVDEFLDQLTEDYTALYNDNAILKNKLKVLSETVEEYRATDNAMRKTLLAAQQMADSIVSEAEKRKSQLVKDAEANADARLAELEQAIAAQEYRLQQAREATAAYVQKLKAFHDEEVDFLSKLDQLVPPQASRESDPSVEIEASISAIVQEPEEPEEPEEDLTVMPAPSSDPDPLADLDPDATRRFEDLQFGKDYEIT